MPGHALQLVQCTGNFQTTHGDCALWGQLEDLPNLPG